jgi:serine/threonine protein kinase
VIQSAPAYMGPEQSEGQIENLGAASDIYSLGATLYKILMGSVRVKPHEFPA